jgi:hypothetical protein
MQPVFSLFWIIALPTEQSGEKTICKLTGLIFQIMTSLFWHMKCRYHEKDTAKGR